MICRQLKYIKVIKYIKYTFCYMTSTAELNLAPLRAVLKNIFSYLEA